MAIAVNANADGSKVMLKSQTFLNQLDQLEKNIGIGEDISESLIFLKEELEKSIEKMMVDHKVSCDDRDLVIAHADVIEKNFKLDELPSSKNKIEELTIFQEEIKDQLIDQDLVESINTLLCVIKNRQEIMELEIDKQKNTGEIMNIHIDFLNHLKRALDLLVKF